MAICFTVDVMCSECNAWIHGTVQYHNVKGTKREARKVAKKKGWVYKKGLDLCVACKDKK